MAVFAQLQTFGDMGYQAVNTHRGNAKMLMTIVLLLVSSGLAGFMVNRLYVLAVYKAINVKGQHYELHANPFYFWFWVGAAVFGLLFGTALFIGSIAILVYGV